MVYFPFNEFASVLIFQNRLRVLCQSAALQQIVFLLPGSRPGYLDRETPHRPPDDRGAPSMKTDCDFFFGAVCSVFRREFYNFAARAEKSQKQHRLMGRAFEYRKARKMKRWGHMARTFTKLGKEIEIAVKAGGPDPSGNTRLRILMQNAKAENMPKENVERAIKRATEKDAADYKEVVYEGYGPHGVAFLVETATDNTNRTVANVRMHFNKCGGTLGNSGSVAFMFDHKCIFKFHAPAGADAEELELEMIDLGVDEFYPEEDGITVYAPYESFGAIQKWLDDKGFEIVSGESAYLPTDTKELDAEGRESVEKLVERLEEDDDVTNVYHTMKEAEEE